MDYNLEDKQEAELDKLKYYQQLCNEALDDFSANKPYQLPAFEKEKILIVLSRLFNAEIDYLTQAPEDYFDIYDDE